MKHFIFDFETMSTNVNDGAIIDCSFMFFDTDKMLSNEPYTMKSISEAKTLKLSMKDQVSKYGWKIEEDTLKFWETVSDEAKARIKIKPDDLNVEDFCYKFVQNLIDGPKVDRWWSRSNTFDPIILWRIFSQTKKLAHLNQHLPYHKVRDIRTFIDAKLDFPTVNSFTPVEDEIFWNKVFVPHNSAWDVLADVLRFQRILRAENDLKAVER